VWGDDNKLGFVFQLILHFLPWDPSPLNPPFNGIFFSCEIFHDTLPATDMAPENRPRPNRKVVVFQPSIFRSYVSGRVYSPKK